MTGWTAERIRDARARHAERLESYDHDCATCRNEVEPTDSAICVECMEPGSDHWTLSGDYSDGADLPEALDEIERMRAEIAAWRRAARGLVPGELAKRLDRMEVERDAARAESERVRGAIEPVCVQMERANAPLSAFIRQIRAALASPAGDAQ